MLIGHPDKAYAPVVPRYTKWIILVFMAVVAVSPIFEVFDRTDEWSQDGSDFVIYIAFLFCFLGFALRRSFHIARLRFCRIGFVLSPRTERKQSQACAEERPLFLAFCDLRI